MKYELVKAAARVEHKNISVLIEQLRQHPSSSRLAFVAPILRCAPPAIWVFVAVILGFSIGQSFEFFRDKKGKGCKNTLFSHHSNIAR